MIPIWIIRNWKPCLIAIATISLFFAVRWWGNHQWAKGEQKGRLSVAADIEKAKLEEWKARENTILAEEKELASERQQAARTTEQLNRDREALRRSLADSMRVISDERMEGYVFAAATPDDRVWTDIRAISRELAGTDD